MATERGMANTNAVLKMRYMADSFVVSVVIRFALASTNCSKCYEYATCGCINFIALKLCGTCEMYPALAPATILPAML